MSILDILRRCGSITAARLPCTRIITGLDALLICPTFRSCEPNPPDRTNHGQEFQHRRGRDAMKRFLTGLLLIGIVGRGDGASPPQSTVENDLVATPAAKSTAGTKPQVDKTSDPSSNNPATATQWKPHDIQLVNGKSGRIRLPAKLQIVNETWNPETAVKSMYGSSVRGPYLVYMPEKNRVLLLVSIGHPGGALYAAIISSDDWGATWGNMIYPCADKKIESVRQGYGLTYLGDGKLLFDIHHSMAPAGNYKNTFSDDYGKTWSKPVEKPPAPGGGMWVNWDSYLADKDPATGKATRLWGTGGNGQGKYLPFLWFTHGTQALLRTSMDQGHTWSEGRFIPEWRGACETVIIRAKNADLVVTCRPDPLTRFYEGVELPDIDHHCGFGISISKDNGHTWSKYTDNMIYGWGRHHSSMIVLPNGDMVMSYVVRVGYVDSLDGFPQFGIEAIVSHDNGRTWDLDHKYILAVWKGKISTKEPRGRYTFPAPQGTSSVVLPDGSILTAFGTGHRIKKLAGEFANFPRDIGLVHWRTSDENLDPDTTIADAPFDSDLRNTHDPNPDNLNIAYISE